MKSVLGWLALAVAAAFIVIAVVFAASFWGAGGDTEMSGAGWTAMVIGIVVTLAVGIGLMALVFYSSRHGYDEAGRDRR